MNERRTLLAAWHLTVLGASLSVLASSPRAVLDVLPSEDAMGPGWKRHVGLLMDPLSTPAEILPNATPFPEKLRKELLDRVQDPKHSISGWCHAHFTLQTNNQSKSYEVHVERYRNQSDLIDDFNRLLTLETDKYQRTAVDGLGDAAVYYWSGNGPGTLWFRMADFRVWVTPFNMMTNWQQDGDFVRLARHVDHQITQVSVPTNNVPLLNVVLLSEVVPDSVFLGEGWQRQIEVLLDPMGKPSEVLEDSSQVAEATLKEWRRSANDSSNSLSGWCHARFDFRSPEATNRYYLHVERYRNKTVLEAQFSKLLGPNARQESLAARRIGDAAFVGHEAGAVTLWFRRGLFCVSVASFGATPAPNQEGTLHHLAAAVDGRIKAATK